MDVYEKMARARAARRPIERRTSTVTLKPMGEQPQIEAGHRAPPYAPPLPQEHFNPIVSPRREDLMKPHEYRKTEVRRVVEAELDGLLEWCLIGFQTRYPRCTAESVRPMLVVACRGGQWAFFRTDDAVGLFSAFRTPWEPELVVRDIGVTSRIVVPMEVLAVYRAAENWARQIGAVEYRYGDSTGVNLDPIAARIGHDSKGFYYVKGLRKPEADAAE